MFLYEGRMPKYRYTKPIPSPRTGGQVNFHADPACKDSACLKAKVHPCGVVIVQETTAVKWMESSLCDRCKCTCVLDKALYGNFGNAWYRGKCTGGGCEREFRCQPPLAGVVQTHIDTAEVEVDKQPTAQARSVFTTAIFYSISCLRSV
jgi:hypothetical protein